jgi:hypothetical protein
LEPTFDGGDDFVGVGGPGERFGLLVVFCEVAVDGSLEVGDRMKGAALEATFRQFSEEALPVRMRQTRMRFAKGNPKPDSYVRLC